MKKMLLIAGVVLTALALTPHAVAQFDNILGPGGDSRADKGPTVIKADNFQLLGKEKRLTYEGHVEVDDTDVVLRCKKMTLYGIEKDSSQVQSKTKENDMSMLSGFGSSSVELDRIEFDEDLVIIRKEKNKTTGKYEEVQRATAGRGVYYAREGRFVLSQKPVVSQGNSFFTGDELVLYRDTLEVRGKNVETHIDMKEQQAFSRNDKEKKPVKKEPREGIYREGQRL